MATTLPLPSSLPQTTSAIAQAAIFPGAAVAQSADKANLASPNLNATHIANIGSQVKGIVSLVSSGIVFLDNWTLATGGKTLKVGATYFTGSSGKLVTSGTQPIGIAITPTSLQVTIQSTLPASSQSAASASGISGLQAQLASLASQINSVVAGSFKSYSGTFAIGNASNTGTVTGLGIVTFSPAKVIPVVRKPVGGLNIFATVVDATISQDGFGFILSSLTDSANYKLDFIMLP